MADIETLRQEAFEALDIVWFVQSDYMVRDVTISCVVHESCRSCVGSLPVSNNRSQFVGGGIPCQGNGWCERATSIVMDWLFLTPHPICETGTSKLYVLSNITNGI